MSRVTPSIPCETCREGIGIPFRAMSAGEDKIQVDVRCDRCQREWRVELSTEPLFKGQPAQASQ